MSAICRTASAKPSPPSCRRSISSKRPARSSRCAIDIVAAQLRKIAVSSSAAWASYIQATSSRAWASRSASAAPVVPRPAVAIEAVGMRRLSVQPARAAASAPAARKPRRLC
jgi:hypothetical protein